MWLFTVTTGTVLHIRPLFECLTAAHLTVHLAKCEFAHATVAYLGHVVGQGKVRPAQVKVLAVEQFPIPTTKKKLMRFLEMVGYYHRFCNSFSSVVAPLTDLLKTSLISYLSAGFPERKGPSV